MTGIYVLRVYINTQGFSKFKQVTWHLVKVLMLNVVCLGGRLRFCILIFNCEKVYIKRTTSNHRHHVFNGLWGDAGAGGPRSTFCASGFNRAFLCTAAQGRRQANQNEPATQCAFQEVPGRETREGAMSLQSGQKAAWLRSEAGICMLGGSEPGGGHLKTLQIRSLCPGWCGSVDWAPPCELGGLLVWFPVRTHAWVAGQVPFGGAHKKEPHIDVSAPPFPLSKNK